jgi:hypothetical protein
MRAVVLGAVAIALAGCGSQSHSAQFKSLTPGEARRLLKSIKPVCPGELLRALS